MLRQLWLKWKSLARKIGDFQARVILILLYFTIIVPFGLALRFLSDPLRTKARDLFSYWEVREEAGDLDAAGRQF